MTSKPIASAPKDGTRILVFAEWNGEIHGISGDGKSWGVCTFMFGRFSLCETDCYTTAAVNPTHWAKLPPTPPGA